MATASPNQSPDTIAAHPTLAEAGRTPAAQGDSGFKLLVEADLRRLAALEANWDSYGAPRIEPAIIAAALQFTRALPDNLTCRPRVTPMSPGNLQFEWHQGKKVLELEFETPQTIRYLQWDPPAGIEAEDSFEAADVGRAVDLIRWFMRETSS